VSDFAASKAKCVYKALLRIGWRPKSEKKGSHVQLQRNGFPDYTWAFHDSDELGPVILKKIAKYTGLKPEDIWLLLSRCDIKEMALETLPVRQVSLR
jgi:predicted RNA binding protein YcfA (HicA-like mRNA interferase family)